MIPLLLPEGSAPVQPERFPQGYCHNQSLPTLVQVSGGELWSPARVKQYALGVLHLLPAEQPADTASTSDASGRADDGSGPIGITGSAWRPAVKNTMSASPIKTAAVVYRCNFFKASSPWACAGSGSPDVWTE